MELTQQARLEGVEAFTNFLTDQTQQMKLLLSSEHATRLIELISEYSRLNSLSAMNTMRERIAGKSAVEDAGRVVSDADQVTRVSHEISTLIGNFWTDQASDLFKLMAGMDEDVMLTGVADINRDESGKPRLVPHEGVDPALFDRPDIKGQIESVMNLMEKKLGLAGATITMPADPIIRLANFLQESKHAPMSFAQHQNEVQVPAFADTPAKSLAFLLSTYTMSVISSSISARERLSFSTIGGMSTMRAFNSMILSQTTLLPSAVTYDAMFREMCNATVEEFNAVFAVRDKAAGLHDALRKVKDGEMTREEFTQIYKNLKQATESVDENDGKFVFSAPASVQ